MQDVTQTLGAYLDRLRTDNPDVSALLLVDSGGQVHGSRGVSNDLIRAAVALAVPLRDLLDRAVAEMGCGVLKATLVEGEDASFALADVDGERTAVVVGASQGSPGARRADAVWLAERLRRGEQA
jgi:predicted regulator of Ras-like GTPase activity (Roadblock/LC7/MglB family)